MEESLIPAGTTITGEMQLEWARAEVNNTKRVYGGEKSDELVRALGRITASPLSLSIYLPPLHWHELIRCLDNSFHIHS